MKRALHVGCGMRPSALPAFLAGYAETRLDIDPVCRPDIVADVRDLPLADASYDAVWSSHNLEHLHPADAHRALREFRRVVRPGGCVALTLPDLQVAAERIAAGRGGDAVYSSPAGPISALDMVFGFSGFTEHNPDMVHRWGWTADTLADALRAAGFGMVDVQRGDDCALWALAV